MASELSDDIQSATSEADAAISRVQATVADLQQQIADLTGKQPTGADLQALIDLKAKLAALDPTNPAVLPA